MKKCTTILLLFLFVFSLNAQVEHSSKAITVSIGLENHRQLFSKSVEDDDFNGGISFSKFSDGYARDIVVAIGSKKIIEDDNYHAWSIFGSGSSWDRNDVFDLQDSLGNTIDELSFFAGKVSSYAVGLRYTYGLSLTHNENLNFLIGFRGELHERFYSAPATEGIGFDTNANEVSLRAFAVPEMHYIVPGKPLLLSFRIGLPVASLGLDSQNVSNPALTLRQQRNGGLSFDLFGFKDSLFEVSFGYFLK